MMKYLEVISIFYFILRLDKNQVLQKWYDTHWKWSNVAEYFYEVTNNIINKHIYFNSEG